MERRNSWFLFLIPSLTGIVLFFLIPYLDVFRRAFFTAAGTEFVGLANFRKVLTNEAFQLAAKNTGLFVLVCIPLLLVLSLLMALFLYDHSRIGDYLKTGFLVPMAIPIAAAVLLWKILFDRQGILNAGMNLLGLEGIDWMNTGWAFWVLVFSYLWKNLGYHIVLWLAGLSMIPGSLYEAARIDGAKGAGLFFRITLPNLRPMVFIVVILALLNSFKVFREAYLVAGNYPHESMYMLQHLFNNWFRDLSLDKMAAGVFLLSAALILLILLLQRAWEKRR